MEKYIRDEYSVGRTLLSDAPLNLTFALTPDRMRLEKVKGVGSECPTHTAGYFVAFVVPVARLTAYPTPNVTTVPIATYQVHGTVVKSQIYNSVANPNSIPSIAPDWFALFVSTPSRKTPSNAP